MPSQNHARYLAALLLRAQMRRPKPAILPHLLEQRSGLPGQAMAVGTGQVSRQFVALAQSSRGFDPLLERVAKVMLSSYHPLEQRIRCSLRLALRLWFQWPCQGPPRLRPSQLRKTRPGRSSCRRLRLAVAVSANFEPFVPRLLLLRSLRQVQRLQMQRTPLLLRPLPSCRRSDLKASAVQQSLPRQQWSAQTQEKDVRSS